MLKKIIILLSLTISAFALHQAELNINQKDLEVSAGLDIGQFNQNVEPNTMFIGGRFLNADSDHTDDIASDLNSLFELDFLVKRKLAGTGFSVGMGLKLNYVKFANSTFSSLPLGLEVGYQIPLLKALPMSIGGSLYYAPEVLSFADSIAYFEYRVHYDIELIENAGLRLGYRNINMKAEGSSKQFNYNDSFYLGFQLKF